MKLNSIRFVSLIYDSFCQHIITGLWGGELRVIVRHMDIPTSYPAQLPS